jgi:hypothetical protein
MLYNKKIFPQGICVIAALLLFVSVAGAQITVSVDPGPRPVGKENPALATCPGLVSAKFPTAPQCINTVQPPDGHGNGGAGQVVSFVSNLTGLWFEGLAVFEVPAVVGPGAQTGGATFPGLGPSFNGESCFQCHSQPAAGGSSPNKKTPGFPNGNPQLGDAPTMAQLAALTTSPGTGIAPILDPTGEGPVREVRFPKGFAGNASLNQDAVSPGAVANLFVIQGRSDAPVGCAIGQEPFQAQLLANNAIFRIPIATFGEGFVENTDDSTLVSNLALEDNLANNFFTPPLGIKGAFNHSGNDQTISRFGWKAQNKSLLIFAGEASNVEMGVTNENFPNERTHGNGHCSPNFEPEDQVVVPPLDAPPGAPLNDTRTVQTILNTFGPAGVASDISSNIENFAVFMRLNASPSQCNYNSGVDSTTGFAKCNGLDSSAIRGSQIFGSLDPTVAGSFTSTAPAPSGAAPTIGCVLCHSDALRTTTSMTPELNNVPFHPFSDFALHVMDSSLSDGVTQGEAGPTQFRTAPLWGLGQRLFFLHDGRTSDVKAAIIDHAPGVGTATTCTAAMGEACEVIKKFNNLTPSDQQALLRFLRSL